jgi:protein CSF1
VSLLGGRIMIKDLRYHSSNQSFRAIKCRVTWRYWLWRTREESNGYVGEGDKGTTITFMHILLVFLLTPAKANNQAFSLPCRLHIALEGVEWHLFNRTTAYNNILLRQQRHSNHSSVANGLGSSVSGHSDGLTPSASDGGDTPCGMSMMACEYEYLLHVSHHCSLKSNS